jgi:site-specific recombinase XerD
MQTTLSRKAKQEESWPRKVQPGRAIVTIYRRKTPSGNFAYMVANYADGERRRFDSYANEADALAAADTLAKRLDKRDYVAASMTQEQAIEYADALAALKPTGVTVRTACQAVAECLKVVGDVSNLHAAMKFYAARYRKMERKPVADVVAELLKVKGSRGASVRYAKDLRLRLERFAGDCNKDCCNVTIADLQAWLDALSLSPQSYRNYRTVLHTLFEFAVARGYAADNPVAGVEKLKVRNGDVEIFKPVEIARLLESARANYPDYLPSLAIGAFAGLRSAEIERLEWKDIDFASRHIVVSASNAKTASRRIVPLCDNLAAWLAPYSGREQGRVWPGGSVLFYKRQQQIALATAVEADESTGVKAQKPVEWKGNALRHSYASYRFAQTGDAGRVAGECGNSAAVIHKHYRELVKPADAERWFNVRPDAPANVLPMPVATVAQ